MRVVFDVEANGLINPSEIWLIVCKDVSTCHKHIFREVTRDAEEAERFRNFANTVDLWIGHNCLGYDWPVLCRLLSIPLPRVDAILDTLILSNLIDYPRSGHSIEDYGLEFGIPKGDFNDFSKYSREMEEYCIRDVDICHRIYLKYYKYLSVPDHLSSIRLEHSFQNIVNNIHNNGFCLDQRFANKLLEKVTKELSVLDKDIHEAFPPRLKLIREVTPKETKYGTISLTSIPKTLRQNIPEMTVGAPFSYCSWNVFNPSSPSQMVKVLNEAGWSPTDKTKGHVEAERRLNKLKRERKRSNELDTELQSCRMVLEKSRIAGWKVNENNLNTLPPSAPAPARLLAKRIIYESRRKTLTEWLSLVNPETSRVHGDFQGIGAWTHRMSHRKPNMANITNEFDIAGNVKLLGKELRQCWIAPKGRLLVGVDAEGIQLRIFAHLVNNKELIEALVNGDKKKKTDPHSYNQRVIGDVCKSRAAAKRFLYALFLGAGIGMLEFILECSREEAEYALERILTEYPGFKELKDTIIPRDAKRGWFIGIDGRKVRIPGEDNGMRRHLAMSGYLQNGEAVVIKTAAIIAEPQLAQYDSFLVDIIHDEFQVECPNNLDTCLKVAEILNKAIIKAGEIYNLNCPMAGSYRNDHGDYTFGNNWYSTH